MSKLRNEKPQNFDMANNKLIVNIFQQTNAIDYILIETGMMKKILLSPNYTSYIVHKVHYTIEKNKDFNNLMKVMAPIFETISTDRIKLLFAQSITFLDKKSYTYDATVMFLKCAITHFEMKEVYDTILNSPYEYYKKDALDILNNLK